MWSRFSNSIRLTKMVGDFSTEESLVLKLEKEDYKTYSFNL